MTGRVIFASDLEVLKKTPSDSVDLIYVDPPSIEYLDDSAGGSVPILASEEVQHASYLRFMSLRLVQFHRILKPSGSLYLQLRSNEAPYVRVEGDKVFGRSNFLNDIIWAFDYGGKTRTRWPSKHENILVWAKTKGQHIFNVADIDREPYLSDRVRGEKLEKGKLPCDFWFHNIVSPSSHEKLGYPSQKPLFLAKRIITASSPPGGLVLDCFAGTGTVGEACIQLGRNFTLVDNNKEAIKVMRKRFSSYKTSDRSILFLNRSKVL